MTKSDTPSSAKTADANVVVADEHYVALTFEDHLRIFWKKNSKAVLVIIVLVLAGIIAKGAWDYMKTQEEAELGREFASATTSEKLNTFAAAHPDHMLTGVARLRVADDAYAAGKSAEAITGYDQAINALKTGPLASRARLGLAMSKIQAGKTADGEAALKALANDTSEAKGIRVEASYHLASLASVAGKPDDVRKYSDLVMQVDPTSSWAQRVFMLRASQPASTFAPSPEITPAVTLPAPGR